MASAKAARILLGSRVDALITQDVDDSVVDERKVPDIEADFSRQRQKEVKGGEHRYNI
jgi:hypothetical protein